MSRAADQPAIPVREFFALDLRSLALFRVALAVLILQDWFDRLPDLRVLYSDDGIVPRAIVSGIQPFSVHMLHGAAWFQGVLFALSIGAGLLLLVGWRTPWACLINFFFLASIHARNPALMQGGDHMLRVITFWSMFLPLGAYWSVDAARSADPPKAKSALSPGSFAYIAQLCIVYWFAAAWKWLGPWRDEGTAVYLVLHVDHFPTRLGLVLRQYPELCRLATHGTIWLETLGPVLLFLPFHVGLQRLLAVAAFLLFHAGLALAMELGHFPFVCMVAWLPLVPSSFWDRLGTKMSLPAASWLPGPLARLRPSTGEPGWKPPGGLIANTFVLFCLAYVVAFNVGTLAGTRAEALPPEQRADATLFLNQFGQLGAAIGLDQGWGLFAPQPGRHVGWHVVAGRTLDGEDVDAYNGGPLTFDKPPFLTATYESGRWRKLRMNLAATRAYPYLLPGFSRFYFDEWNRRHQGGHRLAALQIWWMRETTVGPGETPLPAEKILLGTYTPPTPGVVKRPIVVLGTRADGSRIDLMRGGAVVPDGTSDLGPGVPIINPSYVTVAELADSDAEKYVLPGMARFLLDDWNKTRPKERIAKLQILRVPPGPAAAAVLAEAAAP